jgi:hypothetical protein
LSININTQQIPKFTVQKQAHRFIYVLTPIRDALKSRSKVRLSLNGKGEWIYSPKIMKSLFIAKPHTSIEKAYIGRVRSARTTFNAQRHTNEQMFKYDACCITVAARLHSLSKERVSWLAGWYYQCAERNIVDKT